MGVRDTTILKPAALKFLLLDSLKIHSDDVLFLRGNNPYKVSVNKKDFYILVKNLHESGKGRGNQDEARIQVAKTKYLEQTLSSHPPIVILGYFADKNVFTAWDPHFIQKRLNKKQTISLYTRFSKQEKATQQKIVSYRDNNAHSVITFQPRYLGLYLENLLTIHFLNDSSLDALIDESDVCDFNNENGSLDSDKGKLLITHTRYRRSPSFRKKVYEAYDYTCAMCGMQLELIEAAHIVPKSHKKGNDEVTNGISLCALHHTAYDRSLLYFDEQFYILVNKEKIEYLRTLKLDAGIEKFNNLLVDKLILPANDSLRPNIQNITTANSIRGIYSDEKNEHIDALSS